MKAAEFSQTTVSASEAIVRVIEACGIQFVFGVPGGNAMHLFGALSGRRETIRTVSVRHESLAGVMAEVYGRLTGRPGIVMGQGLFLLTNALLGVLEAHMGSTPMLLMADMTDGAPFSHHAPYQAGTGDYGTWDARRSFGAATKSTLVAHTPAQAVQNTQTAVNIAFRGQGGPVAIVYHSESLKGTVGPESVPRLYATESYSRPAPPCADSERVDRAAAVLLKAEQPVIIAGNGVRIGRAFAELERMANLTGAAVVTTSAGKGVFPEDHPQALGVFGTFGMPAANAFIAASDVIIVVGSKLSPSDTAFENTKLIDPTRQSLIQVDIEPRNAGWVYPCDQVLTGDAAVVLRQLCEAAEKRGGLTSNALGHRRGAVQAEREEMGFFNEPTYASDALPMLPQRVIAELRRGLPENALVTCDAGENRLFMTRFFQTRTGGEFLSPAATGGMGYAVPAAMAAKLLFPERPVIAVCGDGGFAMSMNGLLTAYEEKIPIVTVVLNYSAYGWVTHFLQDQTLAAEFPDMKAADIARAMGCRGMRVETPEQLAGALKEAISGDMPTVIDVICSKEISYRDILSPLVDK
jgi:acetolactate synthase I/II/III large subunit